MIIIARMVLLGRSNIPNGISLFLLGMCPRIWLLIYPRLFFFFEQMSFFALLHHPLDLSHIGSEFGPGRGLKRNSKTESKMVQNQQVMFGDVHCNFHGHSRAKQAQIACFCHAGTLKKTSQTQQLTKLVRYRTTIPAVPRINRCEDFPYSFMCFIIFSKSCFLFTLFKHGIFPNVLQTSAKSLKVKQHDESFSCQTRLLGLLGWLPLLWFQHAFCT